MSYDLSSLTRLADYASELTGTFRQGGREHQITHPDLAADLLHGMADLDREICVVVSLDVKHCVIAADVVAIGTVDHTFMAPREVYRTALLRGAGAIFLAHNHPSGDPTPSADDRACTRRLAEAGKILGVELLDHIVVGNPDWTSLSRQGVI